MYHYKPIPWNVVRGWEFEYFYNIQLKNIIIFKSHTLLRPIQLVTNTQNARSAAMIYAYYIVHQVFQMRRARLLVSSFIHPLTMHRINVYDILYNGELWRENHNHGWRLLRNRALQGTAAYIYNIYTYYCCIRIIQSKWRQPISAAKPSCVPQSSFLIQ